MHLAQLLKPKTGSTLQEIANMSQKQILKQYLKSWIK